MDGRDAFGRLNLGVTRSGFLKIFVLLWIPVRLPSLASIAVLVALTACAAADRPSFAEDGPRTVVEIENQREVPMDIFIVDAGRIRLGRVGPKAKAEFTIPEWFVRHPKEMEFLAMPLSRQFPAISQRVWVGPGERMELVVSQ